MTKNKRGTATQSMQHRHDLFKGWQCSLNPPFRLAPVQGTALAWDCCKTAVKHDCISHGGVRQPHGCRKRERGELLWTFLAITWSVHGAGGEWTWKYARCEPTSPGATEHPFSRLFGFALSPQVPLGLLQPYPREREKVSWSCAVAVLNITLDATCPFQAVF